MMKIVFVLIMMVSLSVMIQKTYASQPLPNILLVVLDDVGFMGLGAYGSDANTPHIDKLAQGGAQFTRYYTAPLCGPSRAMLMTGLNSHEMGMSTLAEALTPEMTQHPSYSMLWQDNQKTLASRLQSSGYQTFASGKWGIGRVGKNLPHRFGFERSFVLDSTGASNYTEKPYLAIYESVKWFEDGKQVSLPANFYSSRNIVDKMINYIDESDIHKPFFGYLSLQAIHIPVQVPVEYIDKYNGTFDKGWDHMRKERLQRAINLGLVPDTASLSDTPPNHRKWDALSAPDKDYWARMMQVNAGMMDAADHHIGRLINRLDELGKLDNTIIIITSDNGPEFNTIGQGDRGFIMGIAEQIWMKTKGWDLHFDNLGQAGSLAAIGAEWALVSSAPLSLYKFNSSEGGQRVPLIIAGPGIESQGLVHPRAHVSDIVPTVLDKVGISFSPDEFYGRSLMPLLSEQKIDVWANDDFAIEVSGNASLYRGDWKVVSVKAPLGDEKWRLYNVLADPGETINLASEFPELYQDMLSEYAAYVQRFNIIELAEGESAIKQVAINSIKLWSLNNWLILLIIALIITSLSLLLIKLMSKRQ
jgi:arylsulfatase/uncharacterized sulfatase